MIQTFFLKTDLLYNERSDVYKRQILNSDDIEFGGTGEKRRCIYKAVQEECDGYNYSIKYALPAYGVAVFVFK